ncbi:MAG: hypothetical protein JST66_07390 [Bacteroidetes bacterium]|nr:hypothetical protein [Bacteroidota bacterium]
MTPPTDRRSLAFLHLALCLGCAFFLGVIGWLWREGTVPVMDQAGLPSLHWTGPVLAAVLVPGAFTVFRTLLARAVPTPSAEALGAAVRNACIVHWALLEGAVFANAVLFLLQADLLALGTAVAALAVLALRAPTPARWARWQESRA